jgi:F-type H+-transporting ATPase subunit a
MSQETANITETVEAGPHIPKMSGETIPGFDIFGVGISNTILSTWVFMALLFIGIGALRLSLNKKASKLKTAGLTFVKALDDFMVDFVGDKAFVRRFFFISAGFFTFILLGNLFSLVMDWTVLTSSHEWLATYLRPINSDLNTTAVMAVAVVLLSQIMAIFYRKPLGYLKGYLLNWSGHTMMEKPINVFVGWLHLIGEVAKVLSLSLRLFGNILAGIILIGVLTFLTSTLLPVHLGEFLVLPFWFFELFVAVVQALVFLILTNVYFKDAKEVHGH